MRCVTFCTELVSYGEELLAPRPTPGGAPLVGCPKLLILYIRSYPLLRQQPQVAPCRVERHTWIYMLHGVG